MLIWKYQAMATQLLHILRLCVRVVADAYDHFNSADGWAIASHIALSILLALFPFLILVTSLAASFFGSTELADEVARLLLDTWPDEVAGPIAQEIRVRPDHDPRRPVDHQRRARDFFRIERHREPAHRTQSRLWHGGDAQLVRAAPGIDRLRAGRRGRAAGDGVPDRARAAAVRDRKPLRSGAVAVRMEYHVRALCGGERRPDHRAGRRAQMASGRTAEIRRDRAGHRRDARAVARGRHGVRQLPRGVSRTSMSATMPASRR